MKKVVLSLAGAAVLLIAFVWLNFYVYPIRTSHPNFSDVERVFSKMQFPPDWQVISESENRGIAGRACHVPSPTWCFHKSKSFKVPFNTTKESFELVLKQTGCDKVEFKRNTPIGAEPYTKFTCTIDDLSVNGGYNEIVGDAWEATIFVGS